MWYPRCTPACLHFFCWGTVTFVLFGTLLFGHWCVCVTCSCKNADARRSPRASPRAGGARHFIQMCALTQFTEATGTGERRDRRGQSTAAQTSKCRPRLSKTASKCRPGLRPGLPPVLTRPRAQSQYLIVPSQLQVATWLGVAVGVGVRAGVGVGVGVGSGSGLGLGLEVGIGP